MSLAEKGLFYTQIIEIMALKLSERFKAGKVFLSYEVAQEIYNELERRNLIEPALLGFINTWIIDFIQKEGIKNWKVMSKDCNKCEHSLIYFAFVINEEKEVLLCKHYDMDVTDPKRAENCPHYRKKFYLDEKE